MSLYHAYTQTVADGTATSVVRPSDWNSAHVQQWALSGNTSGASTVSGVDVVFVGGNNVTVSGDTAGSKIVWSVGNYLTTAMQSNASTQFVQANAAFAGTNATGTIASNGISVSVNPQSVQTQASGAIAGTGFTSTTTAGTAITAALGTNGLTMAVPAYLTTYAQSVQTQASGNIAGIGFTTTTTAGTAVVGTNSTNGLSLGIPVYLTTYAAQTNQTQASGGIAGTGFTSTTTAGTAITAALGTNGLTMAVPQFLTTQSNQAFSAAGGSSAFQTLGFSDNAYASWSNTNGSVALTELRGSFFAVSNTTQATSGTQNFDAVSFAGAGGVSVGVSNGSVIISGATGGAGGGAGTNTALALTNLTGTLSVNTNGVSLSLQNLDDHFSAWSLVGNTVGDNSYTLSTEGPMVFEGGNNVTLSGNSNTIVISAAGGTTNQTGPNIAAGGATATSGTVVFSNSNNITFGLNGQTMTASYADPTETIFYRPNDFLTTVGNPINASASVFYCPLDHNLSATRFDIMASVSVTTAGNTSSAGVLWSLTACMYTLNGGTLSSVSSITTASEWRWQSNSTASATGAMFLSAPLNVSAGADKYWMAVQLSTRATGLTGAATTSLGNTMSVFGVGSAQIGAFSARDPGQATANSNGWFLGMGMYSGTTNFSTIGLSNLTQQGSNLQRADLGIRMRG